MELYLVDVNYYYNCNPYSYIKQEQVTKIYV